MKVWIIACCLLFALPARADIVIVASDGERDALIGLIAAGLQAQPRLVPQAIYLLNKIQTAPVMTSQKEIKPDDPKKDDAP